MGTMAGRRCLVTGAAAGLGRVFCTALAAEGARVAGLDVATLERTAADVDHAGGSFTAVTADVTSPEQVAAGVATAVDRLGGLDVLVNNAGIYPSIPFEETTPQLLRRVPAINLEGPFLVTRAGRLHPRAGQRAGAGRHHGERDHAGMIPTETAVRTGVTSDLDRVVASQAVPRAQRPDDLVTTLLYLADARSGFVPLPERPRPPIGMCDRSSRSPPSTRVAPAATVARTTRSTRSVWATLISGPSVVPSSLG
jgi:3-oxoacyl-[acyl-carrier protein] reductase